MMSVIRELRLNIEFTRILRDRLVLIRHTSLGTSDLESF